MSSHVLIPIVAFLVACAPSSEACCDACVSLDLRGADALPDLDGVECVVGDLVLTGRSSVDDASSLRVVTGSVALFDNPELASAAGLSSLERVGGHLSFAENPQLLEIRIERLEAVQGDVSITDHASLARVSIGMRKVGRELFLANNPALGDADFLELESLEQLYVSENPKLVALRIPSMTAADRMFLYENSSLGEFEIPDELSKLRELSVTASAPPRLAGASSLRELETLRLFDNPALEELVAFGSLTSIDRIVLTRNDALSKVQSPGTLSNLSALVLVENPMLAALDWIVVDALEDLKLIHNDSLSDDEIAQLLDRVAVTGSTKVGGNADHPDAYDPCPWVGDAECDDQTGTGLCNDDADCDEP